MTNVSSDPRDVWWYLSFADPDAPSGGQWLGACIVQAPTFPNAVMMSKTLECNPGGEVVGLPFPPDMHLPLQYCNVLLDRFRVEEFDAWMGSLPSHDVPEDAPAAEVDMIYVDMIHAPPHYRSDRFGVECITFTRHMPFCTGNAFKYVWRYRDKGTPLADLGKAEVYLRWARSWQESPALLRGGEVELRGLYRAHLADDESAQATVLGHILHGEWDRALDGLAALRAEVDGEGQP